MNSVCVPQSLVQGVKIDGWMDVASMLRQCGCGKATVCVQLILESRKSPLRSVNHSGYITLSVGVLAAIGDLLCFVCVFACFEDLLQVP